MFFQISPVKKEKKPKHVAKEAEPEKIEVLSLAPFAPAPKLLFDGVKVGECASCKLLLKNPTKRDIKLFLTKKVPEDLNVNYSWESNTIERESEILFEITWKPSCPESSYHKITFESFKKTSHRDVFIAFTSVLEKPKDDKKTRAKRKPAQKSPTKKYYSSRPSNISSKKYSPSQNKNPKTNRTQAILSPQNHISPRLLGGKDYRVKGKENVPKIFMDEAKSSKNFATNKVNVNDVFYKLDKSLDLDDSLELGPSATPAVMSTPFSMEKQTLLTCFNDCNSPDISFGRYFKQRSEKPELPMSGFEYKLMRLDSYCLTPTGTPAKNGQKFSPNMVSTAEKLSPNSLSIPPSHLNLSNETYIRSHDISSETYVKDNSFETYVKGNISGETYTKDSSVARLECLSSFSMQISPASIKCSPPKLPTPPHTYVKDFDYPRNSNYNFVKPERQVLTSIEEELVFNYEKPKRRKKCDLDLTASHAKAGGGLTGPKDWSKKGGTAVRVAKSTSGLNLTSFNPSTKVGVQDEVVSHITKNDTNTVIIQNPFLLAATNMVDPFITSHLYVNQEWVDEQVKDFKKWLNALLTPPQDLRSEDRLIDVAKVWQECKKREVELAPTSEDLSNNMYRVNSRLTALRKSAQVLFKSQEIGTVLSKVLQAVDSGKLAIRQDKDVHLNLSIKSQMMSIILSYNPLWLRIGLETIYNEIIPLKSNSDVVGLSTFILNRLFKDPYLLRRYKSVHSPKYVADFKKFFLKKYLILVYFLDQAKINKLIPHNPCLFSKTGAVKESKELLLLLARELLSAVGDITKYLKFLGCVVSHVQTYIHEFDYAVKNLGVDLRDGVRLTKVMEIILMKEDFTSLLRVPAISRLQKVHNMKLVFDALEKAGYKILYDISPKDIVDGHREKTLSFLWQIIYKFEAPLMVKSATTIQIWFRSLPVVLKRKKLQKIRGVKTNAASKIQSWYRRQIFSRKLIMAADYLQRHLLLIKMERSIILIQRYYRMYRERKIYKKKIQTINEIQRISRGWLARNCYYNRIKSAVVIQSYVRMFLARKSFLKVKAAAKVIKCWYFSIKQTKADLARYRIIKSSTILIQRQWRAFAMAKKQRQKYETLKRSVSIVQRQFRANRLCKIVREKYQSVKIATIAIQNWYRSVTKMRSCRKEYLTLKQTVLLVEQRYITLKVMKAQKTQYQQLRAACLTIQQRFRAQKRMKDTRVQYLKFKTACIFIQRRYRANTLMLKEKNHFESLKQATITVQRRFRAKLAMNAARNEFLVSKQAALKIQAWYKATLLMRRDRTQYICLKNAVRRVESRYQAKMLMRNTLAQYQQFRNASIVIQRQYRSLISMRQCRNQYSQLKIATNIIQTRFRAMRAMRLARLHYLKIKNAAIVIQRRFRATIEMRVRRQYFEQLKSATITVQRRYRANTLMKVAKSDYQQLLVTTITIQRVFRAKLFMVRDRDYFRKLKIAVKNIQARWRARKLAKDQREQFEILRRFTILIQQRWRANILAKDQQTKYNELRRAVIIIKKRWKAEKLCEKTRQDYIKLRNAAITVQTHWKALKLKECEQTRYNQKRNAAITIQRKYRATLQARVERNKFELTKNAVMTLQAYWRMYRARKRDQQHYQELRRAIVVIQQMWRAKIALRIQRHRYLEIKKFTLIIQTTWRANLECKRKRLEYSSLRKSVIFVQQKWRAKTLARCIKTYYQQLKTAVAFVQITLRNKLLGRQARERFVKLKLATIFIQRRWRALQEGKQVRQQYKQILNAVLVIQQRYKANKLMYLDRKQYILLRQYAIVLQRRFRSTLLMQVQRDKYMKMKSSSLVIQRWYRGFLKTREEQRLYLVKKQAVTEIQRLARGYLVRQKHVEYFTAEAREQRKIQKKKNDASLKIQRLWRGYKSRCAENPKLKTIRDRCNKAYATAHLRETIEAKCTTALQTFVHKNSTLWQIITALEDINYATRRCKNQCIRLHKILPPQLYLLLMGTARSLPEMNACILSVHILINFNKLEETRQSSFVPDQIDNLLTIMMHWCDKESQLFPSLCTLLWLFAHIPQWKRIMLKNSNIEQKLNKMTNLVMRKQNMVKKQVVKGTSLFSSYQTLPMPSRLPDWGLEYKNNPNVFSNSVHALGSLLSILDL